MCGKGFAPRDQVRFSAHRCTGGRDEGCISARRRSIYSEVAASGIQSRVHRWSWVPCETPRPALSLSPVWVHGILSRRVDHGF